MKNFKKKELNSNKGITLIALVVTIIVLLILAGISISMLSGNNGIIQRATDTKTINDDAQIRERIQLAYHSALTGGLGSYTKESLEGELEKEFGENNYNVDDSDSDNWVLSAKGQSISIPSGEKIPEVDYSDLSIGDYVNYPIEYENVETYDNNLSNENYTSWRILSKEGSGKNAYIRLVSAGVPLNYLSHNSEWNNMNSEKSVENLTTKFFETQIDSNNSNGFVFYKCGFKDSTGTKITSMSDLKTLFTTGNARKYTAISKNSLPEVQSLTKNDIDQIWGSTLSNETVTSNDLIAIPSKFPTSDNLATSDVILATSKDARNMWAVTYYGFIGDEGNGAQGIRTVVTLKPKIKFTLADSKINNTNTWNLSE